MRPSNNERLRRAVLAGCALAVAACAAPRQDPISSADPAPAAQLAPGGGSTAPGVLPLDDEEERTPFDGPRPVPFGLLFPAVAPTFEDISPDSSTGQGVDGNAASGGRVNGMAAVPSQPGTFYAASEWGGLYKSVDGGDTWNHLPGHIPQATWDVEVDPSAPLTVYATSFPEGRKESISGIQVSRDGGVTWSPTARPGPYPASTCSNQQQTEPAAFGIAIRPDNPDFVFVGTECGVAVSQDAGHSWSYRRPSPRSARTSTATASPTS